MLQLNTLVEQHSPEAIEQQLIKQYLIFAEQNGVSQQTAQRTLIWILKLVRFHNGAYPSDLNQHDIETFLSALAVEEHVPLTTQHLALSAISCFYREFIKLDFKLDNYVKSKSRRGFSDRLPAWLCHRIIHNLSGPSQLMAKLAYYCQLTLDQIANLKISDIDLKSGTISIFDKDNLLLFKALIPLSLQLDLRIQKMRAHQISHQLNQQSKELVNEASPTQINLFKQQNGLLFILSITNKLSNSETPIEITAESQLAILKSEIRVILKQIKRNTPSNIINRHSKDQTTPITNFTSKKLQANSRKSALVAVTHNNQIRSDSLSYQNQTDLVSITSNSQPDFFDLGAA